MNILIKGMEMPGDCLKCRFCLFTDAHWKCLVDGSDADVGGICRPPRCPLIPAPPIVKCTNCKYCDKVDDYEWWCNGRGFPRGLVTPDGFCNKGKEKEGEE